MTITIGELKRQGTQAFNDGQYETALKIYRLAERYGVPCQMGAHFGETSLLTGAGVLLAALAGPLTACEGAMGEFLLEKDIVQPSIRHAPDGSLPTIHILEQIGLSGEVDAGLVERYSHILWRK